MMLLFVPPVVLIVAYLAARAIWYGGGYESPWGLTTLVMDALLCGLSSHDRFCFANV